MTTEKRLLQAAACLCAATLTMGTSAQEFPSRPLRIVVPFPAGGTTDVVARLVAQRMGESMNQQVLPIATSASKRLSVLPDVPTVRELGFPALEFEGWNGLFVPAKTPQPIVARLHKEVVAAVRHPDVAKRFQDLTAEPVGSTPKEQEAMLRNQMQQFHPVIKEMKLD